MGKTKPGEIEEAATPPEETTPPVDDAATLPDPEPAEGEETPPDVEAEGEEAEDAEVEDAEEPTLNPEAKVALEREYPVLREHGSHNAAMKGLQTSPGYDPTKL